MKLYQVLGVKDDATPEEIKKAYFRLAHKHHPDKGGDPQDWEQLSFAYAVLGDPTKRELYDNFGQTEVPKIEAEIQTVLLQGFSQALQNRVVDVLKFVRDFINSGRTQVIAQKEQAIKEIEELRRKRDSVETTSEENLFHMIVDQAIQARDNLVQQAEIKIEVAKACHMVLDTYKSKEPTLPVVRRPPPGAFHHIFGFTEIDVERMKQEFRDNVRNMRMNDIDFGFGNPNEE